MFVRAPFEDDDKFIAADAVNGTVFVSRADQAAGILQIFIPHIMALLIVDLLEIIHIEKDNTAFVKLSFGKPFMNIVQTGFVGTAVLDTGERIDIGHFLDIVIDRF